WYKLVDKSGKEDKVRGEVLLDIQFMRNNMSVSMFDLSMQDKPRSRISKLKDKVRGKKNEGSSDSVSAIVPPVSQVLTDSEEEADAQSLNHSSGEKKKSKIKNLFASKSNLQRNMSQSMSTLGTLPEKNSSLSASRSSGLNVDSTEGNVTSLRAPFTLTSLASICSDYQSHSQPCPSPAQSESTLSIVPSECPDTFSNLHSSLAPPNVSRSPSGSPRGSTEDLSLVGSEGSSATMADQRRRSPLPPLYSVHRTQPGESHVPVRDLKNPAYVEDDGSEQRQVSVPLPDYNTLFPQKRHGVQGQTQWDHLVSELSQKHRDSTPELMGPEMSVDGPVEQPNPRLHETQENPAIGKHQVTKPVSSKKVAAPAPPRHSSSQVSPSVVVSSERQGQKITPHSLLRSSSPAVPLAADTTPLDEQRKPQVASNKEAPTAKPRQRVSGQEPANQEEPAAKASIQTLSNSNMSGMKKRERENFEQSNQFSSTERLSQDSRAQLQHDQEVDIFSGNLQREQKSEKRAGMPENSDNTFNQEKTVDPFVNLNGNDSVKLSESRKKDEQSNLGHPAFQRRNSSRKKIVPSSVRSENIFLPQQEPGSKEDTASPKTNQVVSARRAANAFTPPQPESHLKQQSSLYGKEDLSPAEAFPSPQHLSNLLEEPPTQAEHLSGGKPLLKAWVSPSEPHSASTQSNNGSGLGLSPRSQLTTEELVKLVAKQQMDLSKKDSKITELEEYIDNLLVRVIEEKPAILQALNIAKPV
ncbi:hypothetical protein XENOCAPTIV_011300, partial [Xenoophorus captivus]